MSQIPLFHQHNLFMVITASENYAVSPTAPQVSHDYPSRPDVLLTSVMAANASASSDKGR